MPDEREVTIELIDAIQDAFNRHDVDGILSHFADDCEWLMARGPDPWEARRLHGKQAIGDVLRARYAVIPDMRWVDISHFISPDGTKACSEWTVKGTPVEGPPIDWLGCDVWTFRAGWVIRKDTYWKTIER
jgi:taurine dehydrogenase small subunit